MKMFFLGSVLCCKDASTQKIAFPKICRAKFRASNVLCFLEVPIAGVPVVYPVGQSMGYIQRIIAENVICQIIVHLASLADCMPFVQGSRTHFTCGKQEAVPGCDRGP